MTASVEDLAVTVSAHSAKHEEHFRNSAATWTAVNEVRTDNKIGRAHV